MHLYQSGEDYLETILVLEKRKGSVRSIDIVNELDFAKPSVSIAMKNLRENGYIEVREHGYIHLLEKGREIAERMYERHMLLTEWLVALGVAQDTAEQDACRIEHCISEESFEAIKQFIENQNGGNGDK